MIFPPSPDLIANARIQARAILAVRRLHPCVAYWIERTLEAPTPDWEDDLRFVARAYGICVSRPAPFPHAPAGRVTGAFKPVQGANK